MIDTFSLDLIDRQPSDGASNWIGENVWAPVRNNVLAPVGNVGIQALNTLHVKDALSLVERVDNADISNDAPTSRKFKPFEVPTADSFAQKAVQALAATAGSILLYTAVAKVTGKTFGVGSELLGVAGSRTSLLAEESVAFSKPLNLTSDFLRAGQSSTAFLSKEQNALFVGATAYNAARNPEAGETRLGNTLGTAAQFGIFRVANATLLSSFSRESGLWSKAFNVVLPRATIGVAAGLAQDFVSHTTTASIEQQSFVPTFGADWEQTASLSGLMNVVIPSLLGEKGPLAGATIAKSPEPVLQSIDASGLGDISANFAPSALSDFARTPITLAAAAETTSERGTVTDTDRHADSARAPAPGDKVGKAGGTNANFPGIDESDAVTKIVQKDNGNVVTVFQSGKAVIREPGKEPITVTPQGRWFKLVDGELVESSQKEPKDTTVRVSEKATVPREPRERPVPPDFSHLPEAERPVNIGSGNGELIAKEMSNFEQSPFDLDGRRFQSVEGFYVWLKFAGDPEKQSIAQDLYSYEAKKFGKTSNATATEYDGKEIQLGSPEHHDLIKRAVQAKLEQYPDIARRFAETFPRPIIHDFGYPEPPSRLPAGDFAKILTDLRQDLVDGKLVTRDGPVSELSARAAAEEASKVKLPISDVLRQLRDRPDLSQHPVERYAKALDNSGIQVVSYLNAGADQIAFETANNQVLKVSTKLFPTNFVPRQFHLHITDSQVVDAGGGLKLQLYRQPKGVTPVSALQYREFQAELKRQGWVLTDGAEDQLSIYNGAVKLHDPFAVQRLRK